MSETAPCPICAEPLRGHAEVTAADGETLAINDCPICGRYALTPALATLAVGMADNVRYNLMARLESRSIAPAVDGTVVLTEAHFVAPRGLRA